MRRGHDIQAHSPGLHLLAYRNIPPRWKPALRVVLNYYVQALKPTINTLPDTFFENTVVTAASQLTYNPTLCVWTCDYQQP
jgi:hypothetical protein